MFLRRIFCGRYDLARLGDGIDGNIASMCRHFRLKQIVKFRTRQDVTLDFIRPISLAPIMSKVAEKIVVEKFV